MPKYFEDNDTLCVEIAKRNIQKGVKSVGIKRRYLTKLVRNYLSLPPKEVPDTDLPYLKEVIIKWNNACTPH